jgi:uncharacterized repeat protein (TIGR01451 family)
VGLGVTTLAGPGAWTGVTVTETAGDLETRNLGDFTCPAVGPAPGGGGGGGAAAAPVVQVSDPAISKAGDPLAAAVGERVTWTIQVWNPGSTPTAPVVFSDTIPPMFDILTVTASRGAVSVSGNTVTVDIGVLQPGEHVTIVIETVGNDQATPGAVCNTATAGPVTATACIDLFPEELPATGGEPVAVGARHALPLRWGTVGMILALGVGYWVVLMQRRAA